MANRKTSQKKKGSQSRLIEEIAKVGCPPPKRAHDNAMVVDEEEEDEVMVSYDLGDDAVVGAVVAGEEKNCYSERESKQSCSQGS